MAIIIENIITTPDVNQKLALKYKGHYVVDSVLNRDRYIIIKDIEGFQITQRPFTAVFGSDRMKLWNKREESYEESENDSDDEDGQDNHIVKMPEL